MPVVIIHGVSHVGGPTLTHLTPAVQDCVAAIKELCLEPKQVSVLMPESACPWERGSVIVFVEGLFEKPERTNEARKRLADALAHTIKEWAKAEEDEDGVKDIQFVEVFVKRFNPDRDGFCALEIRYKAGT